jgi:hypothetical protein
VRARLDEHQGVEAWQVFNLKDEVVMEVQTQEPAIEEAKKRALVGRVRATWHSRLGALQGEVDYSTTASRSKEPGAGAIEKALKKGMELHADVSGSGLRVVSVEEVVDANDKAKNKVVAYAKVWNLDKALSLVAEDLRQGRLSNRPSGWSGSTTATGKLDEWVLEGRDLMAWAEGDEIVVRLKGTIHEGRGGKDPDYEPERMVYGTLTKVGRGVDFFEACRQAVEDPGVFVDRDVAKSQESAVTL